MTTLNTNAKEKNASLYILELDNGLGTDKWQILYMDRALNTLILFLETGKNISVNIKKMFFYSVAEKYIA